MARSGMTAGLCALALLVAVAGGAGTAAAAKATTTNEPGTEFSRTAATSRDTIATYPMPRTLPTGGAGPLVVDHSGNAWFAETVEEPVGGGENARHPNYVVRMNRAGEVTRVTKGDPGDLAVAPDGAIWFTGFDQVERIGTDGSVQSFEMPEGLVLESAIVVGNEGDVWFGVSRRLYDEGGRQVSSEPLIGRLTPSGEMSEFVIPEAGGDQNRLALGPEGNIWFTATTVNRVGYVTPDGRVEEFPSLGYYASPNFLTAGPDGTVWFTMSEKGPLLAHTTSSWAPSGFRLGGEKEYVGEGALVAGPDGRIWFAAESGVIGRLDPQNGRLSKIVLPDHTYAQDLALGPEGEVWYSSDAEPPCLTGDTACGGAGYYTSGIIGRIAAAPLSLELATGKPAHGGHQIKVRVNCLDGDATSVCRGKLRIRAAGAKGGRGYSLGTDGTHTFVVALPTKARTKLLRNRRLAVRVEATLAGGRKASRRFSLKLGAAKKSS
ncbi:MAG: hypothetical protein QM729_02850 [Solirubrobacterales bacterium]